MRVATAMFALLLASPAGMWRPAPGLEGGRYAPTATLLKSAGGTDLVDTTNTSVPAVARQIREWAQSYRTSDSASVRRSWNVSR